MDVKDNVCEKQEAEEIATTMHSDNDLKASTALAKFKDADALVKAYSSLQAEFTRRSQRLKELERIVDNLSPQVEKKEGVEVEKLRKNASLRREKQEQFNRFLSELESGEEANASADCQEGEKPTAISAQTTSEPSKQSDSADIEEMAVSDVALGRKAEAVFSSDELYDKVCADESVRLKIIGEYLSSIGKSGAPLMRGGAGVLATPPLKAKTINEAGNMALRLFKHATEN